jgi:hypothetical protein
MGFCLILQGERRSLFRSIPHGFRSYSMTNTICGVFIHDQAIPRCAQAAYHKWLRYYWDFCHKYHFPPEQHASLPHFLKKLQEKRQTQVQQEQAAPAIWLFYALLDAKNSLPTPGPLFDKCL